MKVLKRLPQKGIIAGVVAGFAEYFAIDVNVLRILVLLLSFAMGVVPMIVVYIIAVIIMPVDAPVIHEHKEETSAKA